MAMAADGSSQYRNRNQIVKWITYTLLLILRFFGIYQRGYIHPDEFFQGGQELFFGIDGRGGDANNYFDFDGGVADEYVTKNVPWEFEPNHAVRSIVPPSFMTLLPLRWYVTLRDYVVRFQDDEFHASVTVTMDDDEQLSGGTTIRKSWIDSYWIWTAPDAMNLSGREILLVPRLFMAVLSVVFLDGSLWILTSSRRPSDNNRMGISSSNGPPVEVLIMASSWPCLAFGVRPFTNSLEAMVLAFLLVIVAMMHEPRIDDSNNVPHNVDKRMNGANNLAYGSIPSLLLIGGICSIGVFVRFTFIFFAFPVVALFLWKRWRGWEGLGYKLLVNVVHDGAWLASSFLLVSCAFIGVDTQYYSHQEDGNCTKLGCILNYIAPLNAFWYNSNRSNLAQHGLHPRMTHIGKAVL